MAVFLSSSCNKEDWRDKVTPIVSATVTFKPQADGSYFVEQDDSTALVVLNKNLKEYPFKEATKEKRALIQYVRVNEPGDDVPHPAGIDAYKRTLFVKLAAMDTIKTKNPVVFDPAAKYGNDPMGLYLSKDIFPTTIIEDGYLNLCFTIPMGSIGVSHEINLVTGVNPSDPYEVELRHNANGDNDEYNRAFIMCFPLKDLPDTHGETVKLTINWNSSVTGKMELTKYDYCSRTDW